MPHFLVFLEYFIENSFSKSHITVRRLVSFLIHIHYPRQVKILVSCSNNFNMLRFFFLFLKLLCFSTKLATLQLNKQRIKLTFTLTLFCFNLFQRGWRFYQGRRKTFTNKWESKKSLVTVWVSGKFTGSQGCSHN